MSCRRYDGKEFNTGGPAAEKPLCVRGPKQRALRVVYKGADAAAHDDSGRLDMTRDC